MNTVIIKYNAGNIRSVLFALERLGVEAEVTDDPEKIRHASHVIFPGVGEASSAMRYLHEHGLAEVIRKLKQPVLGICLGMQLLCDSSEEGETACLGIFPQRVLKFRNEENKERRKIPQMGWNTIAGLKGPLFEGLDENEYVYFVHGYYAELSAYTTAQTNFILGYSAALQKDNFYAVQFHPEKSGAAGERILRNFLRI
ncbi:MAG: glutamine amidotransferase [Bacteroidetes bacterium]|nr:MAG: glutamine amidotransferase [Bacteroidota bacterium]